MKIKRIFPLFLSFFLCTSCSPSFSDYSPMTSSYTKEEEKEEAYYRPSSFQETYQEVIQERTHVLPSLGKQRILVIPVEFSDYPSSSLKGGKEGSLTYIHNAFFGKSSSTFYESVASYYNRSSYGQLILEGKVSNWFSLGKTYEEAKKDLKYTVKSQSILEEAVEWYRKNYDDISSFDQNDDGYIDAVWLIGSAPYEEDEENTLSWAHTFEATSTAYYKEAPYGRMYSWASYQFLWGAKNRAPDTHVLLHETGHLFGLKDYYSSDKNETYFATGKWDMMDTNIGDHNAFSKMLLNWVTPYIITKETTFVLPSFEKTGKCILLTSSWNEMAMDEYLLLEYYTPTGLHKKDTEIPWAYKNLSTYGLRVYHVDARLGYMTNFGNYMHGYVDEVEDPSSLPQPLSTYHLDLANSNTTSLTPKDEEGNVQYLLSLLSPTQVNGEIAQSSILFKKGDTFDSYLQSKSYAFHSLKSIPFSFEVTSLNSDNITLRFYSL